MLLANTLLNVGCAAISNPTRNGVSVQNLADELRAISTEEFETIPLSLLGQTPSAEYHVGPGDLLGVWVEGLIGEKNPPVMQVQDRDLPGSLPPGVGTPVPVQENGTIQLPVVGRINVNGMTLAQVQAALVDALTVKRKVLQPGKENVIVTLIQPRRYRVVVMRQDSANGTTIAGSVGQTLVGLTSRGTGHVLNLPPSENDVLHALALTGGLPGRDAYREVVIHRRANCTTIAPEVIAPQAPAAEVLPNPSPVPPEKKDGWAAIPKNEARPAAPPQPPACPRPDQLCTKQIIRIPLALPPGVPIPFTQQDVILHSGDVVYLESRDRDVFYTGGLLPAGQHFLPRDFDLDVIEAVARVGGPMVNGGISVSNLSGAIIQPGVGNPSPKLVSIVRKTPNGQVVINVDLHKALRDAKQRIVVKPGDVLILQETPAQAITRFLFQSVNFSFGGSGPNSSSAGFFSSPPGPFIWPQ